MCLPPEAERSLKLNSEINSNKLEPDQLISRILYIIDINSPAVSTDMKGLILTEDGGGGDLDWKPEEPYKYDAGYCDGGWPDEPGAEG